MDKLQSTTPIVFFTGATSGFGKIAACELAAQGAKIIATCRSPKKGEALQAYFAEHYPTGKGSIDLVACNLNSFASIVEACDAVSEQHGHLDMIINNAGILNTEFKETEDKIEETWQVNLLAPMLINFRLKKLLVKASSPKIITTASGLHQGIIDFNDLEYRQRKFKSLNVYRQTKLGVILLTRLLAKKYAAENIAVYSQHPGFVNTDLGRSSGLFKLAFWLFGKSSAAGAKTLVYLALAENEELVPGEFYVDEKVKRITKESYDLEVAERLLERTWEYLKEYLK